MKISFVSGKGGVGKTTLANAVARELDTYLVSNDAWSVIDKFNNDAKVVKDFGGVSERFGEHNVVFDFAGHIEKAMLETLGNSDKIVIVTTADYLSLGGVVKFLDEVIGQIDRNKCLIVGNHLGNDGSKYTPKRFKEDWEAVQALAHKYGIKAVGLRSSKLFGDSVRECKTIKAMLDNPLRAKNWAEPATQFNQLLKEITNG